MKCSALISILNRDGWIVKRQNGSHMIMTHPIKPNILVVPNHGATEVGKGLANKLLKQAGLR